MSKNKEIQTKSEHKIAFSEKLQKNALTTVLHSTNDVEVFSGLIQLEWIFPLYNACGF